MSAKSVGDVMISNTGVSYSPNRIGVDDAQCFPILFSWDFSGRDSSDIAGLTALF